ncbi:hypothetical protein WN944_006034 [Citrus x changshan-huyou]|uniref:NB-ARC domain-containing protein n=1 Tax=Citrus x changshan-huyou TaxID=2935761 RepID=A0AAP0QPB7_9ROSI
MVDAIVSPLLEQLISFAVEEVKQRRKKKVCSCFPATCFGFKQIFIRHDIAVKIQEINEELDDIAIQKDKFKFVESASKGSEKPGRVQSTSLIDEEEICGRVDEKNELLSKLLCESSEQQKGLHIISIVGMGGIGKTTLAQLASNHDEVNRQFDKILWVCVSDTFDEFRVAKAMVEALDGHESRLGWHSLDGLLRNVKNWNKLGEKLQASAKGYLLQQRQ